MTLRHYTLFVYFFVQQVLLSCFSLKCRWGFAANSGLKAALLIVTPLATLTVATVFGM